MDNVDINYPFTADDSNKNDILSKKDYQYKNNHNNDNTFQKIGTMLNKKIRKISVAEQSKRNSHFKFHQTQLVIENLSPFIVNANLQNRFHNEPQSPTPKITENFRAFSPCNVSEFDGQEIAGKTKENRIKGINSRTMCQFSDQRKAVSPNFRPIANDQRELPRFKSPIPEKYLPLIMNDGIMNQNGMNTVCNYISPKSRNNSRMKEFYSNGRRCDSKCKQNNFNTIDPNKECAKMNQTFNQSDIEKRNRICGSNHTNFTTIQTGNRVEELQLRTNVVGKVKLKPLKNKSTILDQKKHQVKI